MNKLISFFKNLGKKIWSFLKSLDSSFLSILVLVLGIFALTFFFKYKILERKSNETIFISNDSLEFYKNKAHEEYVAKNTYIMELNEVKDLNNDLYMEIKNLKDHPLVVTKTEIRFVHDTVETVIDSVVNYVDDKLYYWSAKDSIFFSINGVSKLANNGESFSTAVNNVRIDAALKLDLVETKNKQLKVIANSDNPYLEISDISSVVLDPKKSPVLKSYFKPKRFGVGPYIGAGVIVTDGVVRVTPSIGFAVHYDFIQF